MSLESPLLALLITFVQAYYLWILAGLGAVGLIYVFKRWHTEIAFMWTRILYAFPFIGIRAQLSRDPGRFSNEWFSAERRLCNDFRYFHRAYQRDEKHFAKCHSYLDKTEELGRKELPWWGWVILGLLVIAEAALFGMILAHWIDPNVSADQQTISALGIAFVLSSILVFMTHDAGHEMYKNRLARKVKTWYHNHDARDNAPSQSSENEQGKPQPRAPALKPKSVNLENETADDNEPHYIQVVSRVDFNGEVKPTWWVTGITLFLILFIGIGSFYVRTQAVEQIMTEGQPGTGTPPATQSSGAFGTQPPQQPAPDSAPPPASENAQQDLWSNAEYRGSLATYLVLAMVFVALQVVGIIVGYKYGFVGQESSDARRYMGTFNTASQYLEHWRSKQEKVKNIAQKHLSKLQHSMPEKARDKNVTPEELGELKQPAERTFRRFLASTAEAEAGYEV